VSCVPICLLIRHGRTTANATGTLAGWTPGVGLDDTGREQAGFLAQRLREVPVVRVVSSPLQRCLETAEALVEAVEGLTFDIDEALGECRYGAWTGGVLRDLAKEPLWRTVQDQPSAARFPDGAEFPGESISAMQHRAVQAVRSVDLQVLRAHGPDAIWAMVSHGDVIKAILADAAGAHLDHFQRIVVDPASLSAVRYTESRPFVIRVNDAGVDLRALVPPPREADGQAADACASDAVVGGGAGAAV
jgi:probable phosphomutase (TIGR03848 family)